MYEEMIVFTRKKKMICCKIKIDIITPPKPKGKIYPAA